MKTGFSLGRISHRENPVLALYWPCRPVRDCSELFARMSFLLCKLEVHDISNCVIYFTESASKSTKVWNSTCSKKPCAVVLSTWVHRFPSQLSAQLSWAKGKSFVFFTSSSWLAWSVGRVETSVLTWLLYGTSSLCYYEDSQSVFPILLFSHVMICLWDHPYTMSEYLFTFSDPPTHQPWWISEKNKTFFFWSTQLSWKLWRKSMYSCT